MLLASFITISSFAAGHITKAQKENTIECLGHYTATAVLPADTVEVKDIEIALAASKVIREYLNKEGIKNDEINKGMNVYVDKVYGKPFNKEKNSECNNKLSSPWEIKSWETEFKNEGWSDKKLHASWIHLHLPSSPVAATNFIHATQVDYSQYS